MFLKALTLSNILSFGPEPHTVELGPLNVIIGPNGSGKSNFIEAIGLLKAAPRDIREPIREGGGAGEWIWKASGKSPSAKIGARFDLYAPISIDYGLEFSESQSRFQIDAEEIHVRSGDDHVFDFVISDGKALTGETTQDLKHLRYDSERSLLSQVLFPVSNLDSVIFGDELRKIAVYLEFPVDRRASSRLPQKTDLPNAFLSSDASNLGLILNRIKRDSHVRQALRAALRDLYENIDDIDVQVEGGTVQVFVYEGRMAVPATRLSSGTLRFLCLLAILLHPEPPPLICIEEPELGLHPDLIPTVSRLLKEASERTQLIVTTHSDILVDTMTDRPEAVLVAEKGEGGTRLTRLDPERLKPWLDDYRLGYLWTSGEIGGTRW